MPKEEWIVIKVKKVTKERLLNECKEDFLRGHKDFKGMYLSCDFMLQKVIDFYLEN